MKSSTSDVTIIGAGPAGLAVSALLNSLGVKYTLLESRSGIGGAYSIIHPTWRMVSPSRYISLPLKAGAWSENYVTAKEYKSYLESYYLENNIQGIFDKQVIAVKPEGGSYFTRTKDGDSYKSRFVILATGMVSFPNPLPFEVENASEWKGVQDYKGTTTLVIGSGTSATEIATVLADHCQVIFLTKKDFKTVPLTIAGINTHHLVRLLELLPKKFFPSICSGATKESPFDFGVLDKIKNGKITHKTGALTLKPNQATFEDGTSMHVDRVINCTGFRFDSTILPKEVLRNARGIIETKENQSLSHPGLFVLGHPCARKIDSKFLRGIAIDAVQVAKKIKKEI